MGLAFVTIFWMKLFQKFFKCEKKSLTDASSICGLLRFPHALSKESILKPFYLSFFF